MKKNIIMRGSQMNKKKGKKVMVDGIDAAYYENKDFGDYMKKNPDKVKYYPAGTKRVTMNMPKISYLQALELDQIMGMGYQNVIKTAILLGLKQLRHDLGIDDPKKQKSGKK